MGAVCSCSVAAASLSPGDFCHGWQLGEGDGVQEGKLKRGTRPGPTKATDPGALGQRKPQTSGIQS